MAKILGCLLAFAAGSLVLAEATEAAAAPGKPDWCGAYKSSEDQKAKWVDGYIKSEGWSPRVRNYIALGACDKPDDATRQKQVDGWREQYLADFGGTPKDFSEMLAVYANRDEVTKQQTAICNVLSFDRGVSSVRYLDGAIADELSCGEVIRGKLVPSIDTDNALFWADRPTGSEIIRSLIIVDSMTRAIRNGDKFRGAALMLADVETSDGLSRSKLEVELANARYNPFARARLREAHNHAKALAERWRTAVAADPEAKKILIDAPIAAMKTWDTAYQAHKPLVDWAYETTEKLNVDSGTQKGCSAKARDQLASYLAEKKPATVEDAQRVITDPIGYLLASVLRQCEAVDGRGLASLAVSNEVFSQKSMRMLRGPRAVGYFAALDAFSEATLAKRSIPFRSLPNFNSAEENRIANNAPVGSAKYFGNRRAGIVGTAKTTADGVKVTFKKEPVVVRDQECFEDRTHIRSFDPDSGAIVWGWVCRPGPAHTVMRGEEPVVIPTEHAALVTPGRALTFGTDTAATGTPTAYPFEIFADKKKKSLVGYMALPTGSSGPSATAASPKAKKKKK